MTYKSSLNWGFSRLWVAYEQGLELGLAGPLWTGWTVWGWQLEIGTSWWPWAPQDCSLPGSSVHGISQVRIVECIAISFSRGSFWSRDWTHVSCISCIGRWVLYQLSQQGSPEPKTVWTLMVETLVIIWNLSLCWLFCCPLSVVP